MCSWRWRLATRKCRSVLLPYLFSSKRSNVLLQRLYTRTNEQLRRDLREISEKIADMQEDLQVLDMYDMGAFGTTSLFSSFINQSINKQCYRRVLFGRLRRVLCAAADTPPTHSNDSLSQTKSDSFSSSLFSFHLICPEQNNLRISFWFIATKARAASFVCVILLLSAFCFFLCFELQRSNLKSNTNQSKSSKK